MSQKKGIRVVAAEVEHEGRFLITQRRPNAMLPLLWEFPSGRVEEGESDEEALRRELRTLDARLARLGREQNACDRLGLQLAAPPTEGPDLRPPPLLSQCLELVLRLPPLHQPPNLAQSVVTTS